MKYALITHEESQAVTKEFRRMGINCFSCDIKPASGGRTDWHLQMDAEQAIKSRVWDFIGMHPVCTKMAFSGNRHYAPGKERHIERINAVQYTVNLWEVAKKYGKRVYMENPFGALNTVKALPRPQKIQPYYFGDPFQKTTYLWLHNLPPLMHRAAPDLFSSKVTHVDKGEFYEFKTKDGKTKRQPLWYAQAKGFAGACAAQDVQEARSKTFPGIARAMAEQWYSIL